MKKLIIFIVSALLLVIASGFIFPYFYKDKIIAIAKVELNKKTKTKIDFNKDIGLSIFKNFPNLSLTVKDLTINSLKGFPSDTLFNAKELEVTLDITSIIKQEEIKVKKIKLNQPIVNLFINKENKNNWDIFLKEETKKPTESKPFKLNLKEVTLEDATIYYNDEFSNLEAILSNYNHTLSGNLSDDNYTLNNELSIKKLSVKKGIVNYLNGVSLKAKADLKINQKDKIYEFLNNEFVLNDLALAFNGKVVEQNENINLDISLNAPKANFASLISLIPAFYTKDFKNLKADGNVAVQAKAKGIYSANSIPTFDLKVNAKNAWFQFPELPNQVKNINFNLNVFNTEGIKENTTVILNNFTSTMGSNSVKGNLNIKESLSDNPLLDLAVDLNVKLEEMKKYIPLSAGKISGQMQAKIKANGRLVSLKNASLEKINAQGFINAQNIRIENGNISLPLFINAVKIQLNPNFAQMPLFIGKIGENDFNANGKLYNLFSYLFSGGKLKAELATSSNYLNINQILNLAPSASNTNKKTHTQSSTIASKATEPLFPKNIDFVLNSKSNKVKYDDMILNSVVANVNITDQKVIINNLNFNLWEGNVKMKGLLDTQNSKNPNLNYTINANTLSIMNVMKNFKWLQNYLPILDKGLVGEFNTNINFSTSLNEGFKPDLTSLDLNGSIDVAHVKLSNFTTLDGIKKQLKVNDVNKDETSLKNLLLNLSIKKGNLVIKPFNFKIADIPVQLGGSTSLNSNILYDGTIQLPAKLLNGNQNILNNLTKNTALKSIEINDSDVLPIKISIVGTIKNPKLNLNLNDALKSLKEKGTNLVKKQLELEKEKAKELIKKEKEKVIDEVKTKVNEEVKKQTDDIKQKVGDQILKGIFGN
ncbi:MAG: AsmA-like C-terminal region-containing protein [Solirubrobacteraceae bacterium]